jgi:hypothetical protein
VRNNYFGDGAAANAGAGVGDVIEGEISSKISVLDKDGWNE